MLDLWFTLKTPSCGDCLDKLEQQQREKFCFKRDKDRYTKAHSCKRLLLSHYQNSCSPEQWRFINDADGKPRLLNESPLHFNLSHCQDALAIAVALAPVGVDIACTQQVSGLESLAQRVFHPLETHWWSQQLNPQEAFFRLWSLKEAVLKAQGLGLNGSTNGFFFTGLDTETPTVDWLAGRQWQCATRRYGRCWISVAMLRNNWCPPRFLQL